MSWAALGVIGLRKTTYVARNEKKSEERQKLGENTEISLSATTGWWGLWGGKIYRVRPLRVGLLHHSLLALQSRFGEKIIRIWVVLYPKRNCSPKAHSYRRACFPYFPKLKIVGDMYQYTEAFRHYSWNSPEAKKSRSSDFTYLGKKIRNTRYMEDWKIARKKCRNGGKKALRLRMTLEGSSQAERDASWGTRPTHTIPITTHQLHWYLSQPKTAAATPTFTPPTHTMAEAFLLRRTWI